MCVYIIYLSTKWHGKVHLQCDDPLFLFFQARYPGHNAGRGR